MKLAEANDVWRRLFRSTDRTIKSIHVAFENVSELGTGVVDIRGPLTLLCGENGAGKSAALALLRRALAEPEATTPYAIARSDTGTVVRVSAGILNNAQPIEGSDNIRASLGHEDKSYVVSVDPAAATGWIADLVSKDQNFADLLEGLTPLEVSEGDLADIRALVGKDYTSVKIYEIDDLEGFPSFPHFVVAHGGASYSTSQMGKGEASLLYLFWAIRRLTPKSIALIEEPDAFVAVRSHRLLIDWLAGQCFEGDHAFVVSSHSGTIAERFPNSAICLCSRTPRGVLFVENPSMSDLVDRLAIVLHRRIVAIVEDEVAGAFLKALLSVVEPKIGAATEIVMARGNGGISIVLQTLAPKTESKVQFVGVWDGDQTAFEVGEWKGMKLPGTKPPEVELLEFAREISTEQLALALGADAARVRLALASTEGDEHHTGFQKLCSGLDLSPSQLCRRLMPTWVAARQQDSHAFAKLLRDAVAAQRARLSF